MHPLGRVVPVEDLPRTIWSDGVLHLAPALAAAYRSVVHEHGLLDLAATRDSNRPPVGGVSDADARKHFAQAFDGSCARTTLALIDPKGELCHVADALVALLAGGRVAVLDVPCGAGAFFLSVLGTTAELRARGVVPRQPLDVLVLGGDINDHATEFASKMHAQMTEALQRQAISVRFAAMSWNICDEVSTADLLKRFLTASSDAERSAVVISNFSGFLNSSGNWKKAEPQLKDLFRFCSGENSSAVWLEPQTSAATQTVWGKVIQTAKSRWARFVALFGRALETDTPERTAAEFALPLKPGETATARLTVMRFELRGRAREPAA
jgi:hypothetical protein